MKPVVFIPEPTAASDLDLLRARCECLTPWEGNVAPPAELQNDSSFRVVLHEADAVIVRLFKIRKEGIPKAKRLKVIGKHGFIQLVQCMYILDQVGYDGWCGLDLFPYRDDPRKFIGLSVKSLRLAKPVVKLLNE